MSEFVNTVDVLGDDAVTDSLIDRSIVEYKDNGITSMDGPSFRSCRALTAVDLPMAVSMGDEAFYGCRALTSVNLPLVTSVSSFSFSGCSTLTSVDFPLVTSIDSYAFENCSKLTALILRNTSKVATLISNSVFSSTPIASGTGYIYVPAALVDSYKAATNWSTYAAQFRALEDYTVDGTTTGELDPNKI